MLQEKSHGIGVILCLGTVAMNHFVLASRLKAHVGHKPVRGREAIKTDRIGMLRSESFRYFLDVSFHKVEYSVVVAVDPDGEYI